MTARLKLDFRGCWLGVYTAVESGNDIYDRGLWRNGCWRRRICIALLPFVTLVLYGRWRCGRYRGAFIGRNR